MMARVMLPHSVLLLIAFVFNDVIRMAWTGVISPIGLALTWCWALFVFSLVALRVLHLLEKPLDTPETKPLSNP